jgi:hypothetical protein
MLAFEFAGSVRVNVSLNILLATSPQGVATLEEAIGVQKASVGLLA